MISLIAARSLNKVIGKNGVLPWHLPADLAWFKQHTLDQTIIMGRKTWDSLPIKPLQKRVSVIVSNGVAVDKHTCTYPLISESVLMGRLDDVLDYYEDFQAVIIGGASIYEQSFPRVRRLYLTEVQAEVTGDNLTYFPAFDESAWRETYQLERAADENNEFGMVFRVLERRI